MCGIIGYSSKCKNACDAVLTGLKNLEYRGYDSAGIATFEEGNIKLYKSQGKISALEDKLKEKGNIWSSCAIGHTRWATHGIPNEINAHPHICSHVCLVHNGIIENYIELKNELLNAGYTFKSSTDSEVACAYINYMYENELKNNNFGNDLEKAKFRSIIKACNKFRGSYAFSIIFDDEINSIYATRKDSPLILGLHENGNFTCSDISAILEYTNKYILLEHNEYAKVTNDSVSIYDSSLNKIYKEIQFATWSANSLRKNGYEHFMLKEIHEQPEVIKRILNSLNNKDSDISKIDFSKFDDIHVVACGSAMHAGLVGKYLLENYADIKVTVEIASEYRYKNSFITDKTLVIIVSQSGETADSLASLRLAKQKGATTLAIVNAVGSTIAREADITIYTHAGVEIAVATTKGYTSQVAIFVLLTLNAMKNKKLLSDIIKDDLFKDVQNIDNIMNEVINKSNDYINIAKSICNVNDLFFIGRGIDYTLCMEGSLKLKEISYMHSEAYAAGELKHGTISLIEQNTPIIAIATDKTLFEKTISNITETKARGAKVYFITTNDLFNEDVKDFADKVIILPTVNPLLMPLLVACTLQLIAYETAKLRNCDIDKPKNLAKSVTVE